MEKVVCSGKHTKSQCSYGKKRVKDNKISRKLVDQLTLRLEQSREEATRETQAQQEGEPNCLLKIVLWPSHVLWGKHPHPCVSTHTHRHTYTIIAGKSFSVTEKGACVSTLEETRCALQEIFSISEEWGKEHWEVFIWLSMSYLSSNFGTLPMALSFHNGSRSFQEKSHLSS